MTKASKILQNAQDQMKVILEIYGDEFIEKFRRAEGN
jgi:exonuclease VII small subunit